MEPISPPPLLLRLPREIRQIVYEHVLVLGNIAVEPATTKAPRSRIAVGGEVGFSEALYQQYKLRYPLSNRSTWAVPLCDLGVPEPEFELDSSTVHMTYQITSPSGGRQIGDLCMPLLQVCKQIYDEATEVLYGKNTFSFTKDFRIPTAATFLRDRPAASLRLIKSIELNIMDTEEGPPSDESMEYSSRHVLQYDYGLYAELCNLLSPPKMSLRSLALTIETVWKHVSHDVFPLPGILRFDSLRWSMTKGNGSMNVGDWVHPLLRVTTLDRLSIFWVSGSHIRMVGQTVALMDQHMLRGRPSLAETPGSVEILYRSLSTMNGTQPSSAVIIYDAAEQSIVHRECAIRDDGRKLTLIAGGKDEGLNIETERPLVREYLGMFNSCLTCYCELRAK